MNLIEVAAAIIENAKGELLVAKRKKGKAQEGLWEFPGGKLEPGESAEDCLRRELWEEMQIKIEPYAYFARNDHHYGSSHIHLIAYKSRYISGEVKLLDHDEYLWINRRKLTAFNFAPADIKFVEMLVSEKM